MGVTRPIMTLSCLKLHTIYTRDAIAQQVSSLVTTDSDFRR